MLQKLKNIIGDIEDSPEFEKYKEKNPNAYLVSAFTIKEDNNFGEWQTHYFSPQTHLITSFILKDKIYLQEEKIFQKEKEDIEKLDLAKVKITLDQALEIIKKLSLEKYPQDLPSKIIIILQTKEKEIWNLAIISNKFNIINIKIDAQEGNILSESIESGLSFRKT